MTVSRDRTSGWCDTCHVRSSIPVSSNRLISRRSVSGIVTGVVSGLIANFLTDTVKWLWSPFGKERVVSLSAHLTGHATVSGTASISAPRTVQLAFVDVLPVSDHLDIRQNPELGEPLRSADW
jgi:hypothetical protein